MADSNPAANGTQLVVRGDDMGVAHAVNQACIRCYREGIMRTVEVMVPGQWFPEAVQMLKDNPNLDVGVHLTLTAEWERVKWRPITGARGIADENGFFYPMTSQRQGFPPNTGFLECGYQIQDVERELRAQIELAKKHIPQTTHLSTHMGTATCMPDLKALTLKLAREYDLELELPGSKWSGGFDGIRDYAAKEARLADNFDKLVPGLWLFVDHPGLDVPEMQAMGHKGYEDVSVDREGVTRAMCSHKVKQVIARKGIKLMSYGDVRRGR